MSLDDGIERQRYAAAHFLWIQPRFYDNGSTKKLLEFNRRLIQTLYPLIFTPYHLTAAMKYSKLKVILPFLAVFYWANVAFAQFSTCLSDPTVVSDLPMYGNYSTVVSDENAGAFFHFYAGDPNQLQYHIWCQRINSDGYRMWGDTGLVVCQTSSNQGASAAHGDGAGGYYVSWTENRYNGPYQNRFGQHFNANGIRLWGEEGLYLGESVAYYPGKSACTLSDGSMVTGINGSNSDQYTYFQVKRYLPDGTLSWTTNLDTTGSSFSPRLEPDEAGGVFVHWQINDDQYIQHIDNQGNKWSSPLHFFNMALYWCYSAPQLITGKTIEEPGGYFFLFQQYDKNRNPLLPGNGKQVPVVGYTSGLAPSRYGGFYMEHQSHLSKIDAAGNLSWQTTLPGDVNMGGGSGTYFQEINPDTMVVAYSGNGMIAFDAAGSIIWKKNGNPLFSNPFGLVGACTTTDGRFISGQYDPNGSSILMAKKWNADGTPYGLNEFVDYTITGPDSVAFGNSALISIQPDTEAANIVRWLVSANNQNYYIIPGAEQQVFATIEPFIEDSWVKVVVKRGATCYDTLGPVKIRVYGISDTDTPWKDLFDCSVKQIGNTLQITLPTTESDIPAVSIFSATGQLVLAVVDCDLLEAGVFSLTLPSLPAGIYGYQVRVGKRLQGGKMVIGKW